MNTQKEKHLLAKVAAVMLISFATVGGTYSVQASGLTGSYVGIGKAPASTNVVDKGSEVKSTETKIIDYRQTFNTSYMGGQDMYRTPKNDNANGEGVDGVSSGNDIDGKGTGNTAIGFGTYAARSYSTAIGTYASAITNSTAVGSGSYAASKSVSFGQNAYANTNGLSIGLNARSSSGLAIGQGATAGIFYKYLQNDGVQNYSVINDSMAIGNNATAIGGIAIGKNAKTNSLYGVALGQSASVTYSGTALGTNAKVYVSQGVALGPNSVSNRYSNTIGYVPFADDGGSYVPKDISGLATAIGASDSLKAFNTKYANQITEYNKLNQALYDAQAKEAEQETIMVNTKGSANEDEQNQYTAAKALKEQYSAEAVAATKALNEWVKQNQDFATDLGNQKTELGTFKSTAGAVSVGSTEYDGDGRVSYVLTRQITNVAAGTEDTDAVNVAQLRRVADETAKKANLDASNITPDQVAKWQEALGIETNTVGYVDAITLTQGDNVKIESTYNDDKSRVNYKISVDDSAIKDAIQPELDQKADRDGSNLTETDIKGWKDTLGVSNLNSDVSNLQDQVTGLDNRVSSLNDRVDKVGAGAAALAGLHPLEFNPEDKFSASAALGNYKGDNAVALGAFYRPNADTMFSFGTTISDEKMFNVGVSFKFGNKGDRIYRQGTSVDVSALTSEVNTLRQENQALASQVNSQKAELEQQRALIQQLMNKVGM
ncbi:MAG: YadA-like family protein [Megasphaera massiliensis]|uniref:YadA-like family protein n=1 Tax=Megasphaera massiliensis TaxID=1232428 RepID=UPI00210E1DE5|nr:YadA-like family protein [Megasphaera massiliensis]MCQ5211254.1 YadA-like family protein [Megasphaera massiliensis]MEE0657494.1 YadA-like family protein [Megasphaera massiliensis]